MHVKVEYLFAQKTQDKINYSSTVKSSHSDSLQYKSMSPDICN